MVVYQIWFGFGGAWWEDETFFGAGGNGWFWHFWMNERLGCVFDVCVFCRTEELEGIVVLHWFGGLMTGIVVVVDD